VVSLLTGPRGASPLAVATPTKAGRRGVEQCHLHYQEGQSDRYEQVVSTMNVRSEVRKRTSGLICRTGVLLIRIYHST